MKLDSGKLERWMQIAQDAKKEFRRSKDTGTWSWYDRGEENSIENWHQGFATFLSALKDAIGPYGGASPGVGVQVARPGGPAEIMVHGWLTKWGRKGGRSRVVREVLETGQPAAAAAFAACLALERGREDADAFVGSLAHSQFKDGPLARLIDYLLDTEADSYAEYCRDDGLDPENYDGNGHIYGLVHRVRYP